jgi:hypothetical protein
MTLGKLKGGPGTIIHTLSPNHSLKTITINSVVTKIRIKVTITNRKTHITSRSILTMNSLQVIMDIKSTNHSKTSRNMRTMTQNQKKTQKSVLTNPCPHPAFPTETTATPEASKSPLQSTKSGALPIRLLKTKMATTPIKPPGLQKSTQIRPVCKGKLTSTIDISSTFKSSQVMHALCFCLIFIVSLINFSILVFLNYKLNKKMYQEKILSFIGSTIV